MTTPLCGAYYDDLRLDAAGMVYAAITGDAEGVAVIGEANAHRAPALCGTLVALVASVLRALPAEQRDGVLAAWRRA